MGKQSKLRQLRVQQVLNARNKVRIGKEARAYDILRELLSPQFQNIPVLVLDNIYESAWDTIQKRLDHKLPPDANDLHKTVCNNGVAPFDVQFVEIKSGSIFFCAIVACIDARTTPHMSVDAMRREIEDDPNEAWCLEFRLLNVQFLDKPVNGRNIGAGQSRYVAQVFLDEHGHFLSHSIFDASSKVDLADVPQDHSGAQIGYNFVISSALFAFSLLNCKNIDTVEHIPTAQKSREFERHYGNGLTKFKTLRVLPIGKRGDQHEGESAYQGIVPLHIRRGHFATYTDAAPLFGKYVGTFWRPATAVGNKERGIVAKDYQVEGK